MKKHVESGKKDESKRQLAAFRKAARELGADAGDDQFKGALRTIAKAKPQPQPKVNKRD